MATYSTYEAKARLSEILRQVREGKTVYISYRGETVAEIRPFSKPEQLSDRMRRLEDEGVLVPPHEPKRALRPVARKPGALARFLADRDT
jgi:prevent-host-death family protein